MIFIILFLSVIMTNEIIDAIKNSKSQFRKFMVYTFILLVVNEHLFSLYETLIHPLIQ